MKRYDYAGLAGMDESHDGDYVLYEDHLKDKEEARKLIKLIRDDLSMRSNEGVVDISNFIWVKINNYLSATLEGKDNE